MFKIAENNSSIITTKSKKRHRIYKEEMQLASFIKLIHSFQVHIVTYYVFSITSYKLEIF